jgi:hypothetical protein
VEASTETSTACSESLRAAGTEARRRGRCRAAGGSQKARAQVVASAGSFVPQGNGRKGSLAVVAGRWSAGIGGGGHEALVMQSAR